MTLVGKRAEVYWNLHTDTYSVRVAGTVVAHPGSVVIKGASFVISARLRRLFDAKRSRRNVHAWVRGEVVTIDSRETLDASFERVRFNPHELEHFIFVKSRKRIDEADLVVLTHDRQIYVKRRELCVAQLVSQTNTKSRTKAYPVFLAV